MDTALKALTPLNGDIVKGQSSFAQYVAGVGWIGKNTLLIHPKAGSYFFLAELIIDLEVVYDDTPKQQIWCLLHSGSRNICNRTAMYYDHMARHMLEQKGRANEVKRLNGMNYMPIDSQEGQDYLTDMDWCQKYAYQNRKAMKEYVFGKKNGENIL